MVVECCYEVFCESELCGRARLEGKFTQPAYPNGKTTGQETLKATCSLQSTSQREKRNMEKAPENQQTAEESCKRQEVRAANLIERDLS